MSRPVVIRASLERGDIVVNKGSGEAYTVIWGGEGPLSPIAVRTVAVSHADEWTFFDKEKNRHLDLIDGAK